MAEPAGESTVTVLAVGAVQTMAAQLHVTGFIVTVTDYEIPEFPLQSANVVKTVIVLTTAASMCELNY